MPFTEEKSMYINHNGMATNVANTLTSHYGNLSTSTERLSSGMRINSSADDAAGLGYFRTHARRHRCPQSGRA